LDRRVVGGNTGMVGEFGFLPVGANGHTVERLAAAEGLVRSAQEAGLVAGSAADVLRSADPAAADIRAGFERALGVALTTVTLAYEPDLVVLCGRVAEQIDAELLDRIRDRARGLLPESPTLVRSALADRAGSIGALA